MVSNCRASNRFVIYVSRSAGGGGSSVRKFDEEVLQRNRQMSRIHCCHGFEPTLQNAVFRATLVKGVIRTG